MRILHKNCLPAYWSNWLIAMDAIARSKGEPALALRIPQPLQSLIRHEYNLCMMLELFDDRLIRFETTLNTGKADYGEYSEAMGFLDAIYLFSRLLLDSTAGIVRHFYSCNKTCELPKSFDGMFKKSVRGELPNGLNTIFLGCKMWFPRLKDRRDDVVHHYETYFIGFERDSGGKMATRQFSPRSKTNAILGEDLRLYIGGVMAGYQLFIDALLDHWDKMFRCWYGIVASINSRTLTILEGRSANILWWAYRYGGYKNDSMLVDES
jgi:hypothetical protein